jgi:hypothetical protein
MPEMDERNIARVTTLLQEEYPKISYMEIRESPTLWTGMYDVSIYGHFNGSKIDSIYGIVTIPFGCEMSIGIYKGIKDLIKGGVFDND